MTSESKAKQKNLCWALMIKFIDCIVYQGTKKIPIDAHGASKITKDLETIQFVLTLCTFVLLRFTVANIFID